MNSEYSLQLTGFEETPFVLELQTMLQDPRRVTHDRLVELVAISQADPINRHTRQERSAAIAAVERYLSFGNAAIEHYFHQAFLSMLIMETTAPEEILAIYLQLRTRYFLFVGFLGQPEQLN